MEDLGESNLPNARLRDVLVDDSRDHHDESGRILKGRHAVVLRLDRKGQLWLLEGLTVALLIFFVPLLPWCTTCVVDHTIHQF
jgi:hypothetical protein